MISTPPGLPPKPTGAFRLLHTADWHLGKLLNDQSRDEEHRLFLGWLLAAVKEHAVDAIVLAGDVFDTANPPQTALGRYYDFVSGLFRQGNCSLAVIAGNHDSAAQLEAPRQALQALHVHVFGSLAESPAARLLPLPNAQAPRVVLAMLPFLRDRDLRTGKAGETAEDIRAQIVAGIRARYAEAADAVAAGNFPCPALATGHLTVLGAKTSESERDIHIGGLGAVTADAFPAGFAYVALGHLHRPQATDPAGRVRYAGSPIALGFSEAEDAKEVRLLDLTADGLAQHALAIPVFRRLLQVRTTVAGLAAAIQAIAPGTGALRTWVEVVVEDATLEEDVNERVQALAAQAGVEVLKVLRGNAATLAGLSAGEATDDEVIDTLLDHPIRVFEHLLEQQEQLEAAERSALTAAFAVLLNLEAEAQADPEA